MKKLFLTLLFLLSLGVATSDASWLIFHKPEFKGKIVDIETNEPIEGAAVVAIYRKQAIGVGDSVTMDFDASEAVTDKAGNFIIPSYTNVIQPLSWSIPVEFIIYKPGYVCDGTLGREDDFSSIGTINDRDYSASWNQNLKYRIMKTGIVMLRKVSGFDRIKSYDSAARIYSLHKNYNKLFKSMEVIDKENDIIQKLEKEWIRTR